ncbi:dephospho-CoA kinase [Streptococcus sp.]|uniref:dephospho-CoA kinase n=1 Tax=Streptococcus sp. TaxID=1306 RepID=UPI00290EDC3F|nr:dephospho-CoA kinase [Streptococcus sp.]MDU5046620.1 dephospho-CoA kinase [Streptococcus sp.]
MIIGLTGGIASGKSTVVEMIKEAGYKVIDADQLVHDMQAKGGRLYRALLDWLGEEILLPNGELNRSKLGQLIFSNEEMRHRSAEIQGTIIREELATQRDCLAKKEDVFFMDIPLLIENGYQDWFDQIWLVAVSPEVQRQRLMKRNHLSSKEASMRIASQMSLEEKKPYASLVLDNNASLDDLKEKVKSAINDLPSSS